MPEGKSVLAEFYKLAIHCFASFPIPELQLTYIDSHLKVDFTDETEKKSSFFSKKKTIQAVPISEMMRQIVNNWQETKDRFEIDLKLCSIEVLFTYGRFEISDQEYESILMLIESLKKSIIELKPYRAA